MARHNPGYIALLVLLWLVFALLVIINMFAFFDSKTSLFSNNVMLIPDLTSSNVLLAHYGDFIWIITYAYQLMWLIYLTTTYIRKDDENDFIYVVGPVHHWSFMLLTMLAMGQRVTYIFLVEYKYPLPAAILGWTAYGTSFIALILAVVGLAKHNKDLQKVGLPLEHRLVVGFVHNGLGMFTAELLVDATSALGEVLVVRHKVDEKLIFGILLVIVFGLYTVYAVLEQGFFEKYIRFLFTPYIVLILLEALLLANTYNMSTSITILALGSLITTGIVFLIKIVRSILEEIKRSAFTEEDYNSEYDNM